MSETRLLSCLGSDAGDWGKEGRKSIPCWAGLEMTLFQAVSTCLCGDIGLVPSLWGVPDKDVTSGAGNT